MGVINNLTGKRFGRLVIGERMPIKCHGKVVWSATCDCGTVLPVNSNALLVGNTTSCGCYRIDIVSTKQVWRGMVNRQYDMPQEWIESFDAFLADVGFKPSKEHVLARGDNSKGYSKANCYWNTVANDPAKKLPRIQVNLVKYNGDIKPLTEWCTELNLPYDAIRDRIKKGMPVEKAFTDPVRYRSKNALIPYGGTVVTLPQLCRTLGMAYSTVIRRISRGMSVDALIAEVA